MTIYPGDRADDAVDLSRPNAARMYDYFLGGSHNFAVDRDLADQIIAADPALVGALRANRAFLARAVRYALDRGIVQFLDLGCGIPIVGSVHQLVHAADPAGRVVCVDVDPVAIAHTEWILADTPTAGVIHTDVRDTNAILGHEVTRKLLDLTQPLCLLAVSVLHFVDGDVQTPIATLRDWMPPGSLLVISHLTNPDHAAQADAVEALYARTSTPIRYRSSDEIAALFAGFDLVPPDPGTAQPARLVPVHQWRPEPPDDVGPTGAGEGRACAGFLAGVGHKPHSPTEDPASQRRVKAHNTPRLRPTGDASATLTGQRRVGATARSVAARTHCIAARSWVITGNPKPVGRPTYGLHSLRATTRADRPSHTDSATASSPKTALAFVGIAAGASQPSAARLRGRRVLVATQSLPSRPARLPSTADGTNSPPAHHAAFERQPTHDIQRKGHPPLRTTDTINPRAGAAMSAPARGGRAISEPYPAMESRRAPRFRQAMSTTEHG